MRSHETVPPDPFTVDFVSFDSSSACDLQLETMKGNEKEVGPLPPRTYVRSTKGRQEVGTDHASDQDKQDKRSEEVGKRSGSGEEVREAPSLKGPTSRPTQTPKTDPNEPNQRPCAHCGQLLPVAGPHSSWPWTNRRRICVPCLRKVDEF